MTCVLPVVGWLITALTRIPLQRRKIPRIPGNTGDTGNLKYHEEAWWFLRVGWAGCGRVLGRFLGEESLVWGGFPREREEVGREGTGREVGREGGVEGGVKRCAG